MTLEIKDVHVAVDDKEILKGVTLSIPPGKVIAFMGPNGSGKSTLANALMGNPKYKITKGTVLLDGVDITTLSPDARSRLGLFLSFQYPQEISGVSVANFLRIAYNARQEKPLSPAEFSKLLKEKMSALKIDQSFAERYLNEGFSGGEKKRNEILQLAVLEPKYALLDETDSGLDIDALRIIAEGINTILKLEHKPGVLIITHYQRILDYIKPDAVHVLIDGRIVKSSGAELVKQLEEKGYDWLKE